MHSGYNQFCPIAKTSEIVAVRWMPLILRELMADIRTFNDIQRGIPLISREFSPPDCANLNIMGSSNVANARVGREPSIGSRQPAMHCARSSVSLVTGALFTRATV